MCITYLFEAQIYIENFFYLLVHFPMATFVAGPGWSRKQELHLGLPRDTVTQGVTSSSASWGFSREMNWMCCSQDSSCCPSWDVGIAGAGLIHYATVLAPGTCCWSPQVGMAVYHTKCQFLSWVLQFWSTSCGCILGDIVRWWKCLGHCQLFLLEVFEGWYSKQKICVSSR